MGVKGKRRIIYKKLGEPYRNESGVWKQKVELVCGHVAIKDLGQGPNSSKKNHKFLYCFECLAEDR